VFSILKSKEDKDILVYSSESSEEYEGGTFYSTLTSTPSFTCVPEPRTQRTPKQEGHEEEQKENNSQKEVSEFGKSVRTSANLSELPPLIRDILVTVKGAGLALDNKEQLAEATAHKIKQQHAEWCDYDVLGFYKKLEENDTEIQGLVADLMRGRQ
jgi:hypothetical protein